MAYTAFRRYIQQTTMELNRYATVPPIRSPSSHNEDTHKNDDEKQSKEKEQNEKKEVDEKEEIKDDVDDEDDGQLNSDELYKKSLTRISEESKVSGLVVKELKKHSSRLFTLTENNDFKSRVRELYDTHPTQSLKTN